MQREYTRRCEGECGYTRGRGRDSSRVLGTAAFRQSAKARNASNAWLRARNSGDAVRELKSSSSRTAISRSASVMRGTMRAAFDSNRADIMRDTRVASDRELRASELQIGF